MTTDDDLSSADLSADLFTDPLELAALPDATDAVHRLDRLVWAGWGGVRARLGLGIALTRANDAAAAVTVLQEAAFLAPNHAAIRTVLGTALLATGAQREAIAALQHALHLAPDDEDAALQLGHAWASLGERDRALGFYDQAGEAGTGPAAALRAAPPAQRHTPAFVRALFDGYAATYDANMRGTLGYRGPELLVEALQPWLGAPAGSPEGSLTGSLAIGDLGCGTGLCGPLLRSWAARIEGVDLSPRMLAVAARNGAYDALHQADLLDWLGQRPAGFDLLVAADVLNYFGDLAPVFAAAARALRPGGRFAFSVETASGQGWSLGPKRRFCHAGAYLTDSTLAAGLRIDSCAAVTPRREAGMPVEAMMIVAALM